MCKEELNQEIEQDVNEVENIEEKTLDEMSKDELIDVICQLMDMKEKEIEVDTENIQNLELDKKEFTKGLKSMSLIAGQFCALTSVGIDNASAIDVIVNMANTEFNLKLNQMTCDSNEKTARFQQVNQEQNSI